MAESQATIGLDTTIEIGDGASPEVFTAILEPKDIDGPEITQEDVDVTHMQSTGGFRESMPTFKSSGQVTFKCNYVKTDAGQIALIASANAVPATLKNYKETLPDGTIFTFAATPSVKWTVPMAGPEELSVTLKIKGAVTVA